MSLITGIMSSMVWTKIREEEQLLTDVQIHLFNFSVIWEFIFHLPYRQTEGVVVRARANSKIPSVPDYSKTTTINRRTINKLDIKLNNIRIGNDIVIVLPDSTGIKITNRGEWLPHHKWNVRKRYLKIHVVVVDISRKRGLFHLMSLVNKYMMEVNWKYWWFPC